MYSTGTASLFNQPPASMPAGPTGGAVRLPGGGMDTSALMQKYKQMYPTTSTNALQSQINQDELRNNNARQNALNQENPMPPTPTFSETSQVKPFFPQSNFDLSNYQRMQNMSMYGPPKHAGMGLNMNRGAASLF